MTKTTAPRRSQRLIVKKNKTPVPVTKPSSRVAKSQSSTLTSSTNKSRRSQSSSSRTSVDRNLLESKLTTQKLANLRKYELPTKTSTICYTANSASSSNHSTDFEASDEEGSDDEYDDLSDLSGDHFQRRASHNVNVSRKLSYDSRHEPGNDEYETDEFVVGDDEDVEEWSSSGEDVDDDDHAEEVEEDQEDDEEEEEGKREGEEEEDDDLGGFEIAGGSRRSSNASKLFYSDPEDKSSPLAQLLWSDGSSDSEMVETENELLIMEADDDLVEEILDALAMFSRRCNRGKQPIRMTLTAEVLEDREVKEALESAMKLGLGRKLSLGDGSKRWTIGPKSFHD
jgi:hypothetical protein